MCASVAITGGAGFIGSSVADWFSRQFSVRILDKEDTARRISRGIDFVECDVRNSEQVIRGLEDIDVVVHAAILQIPKINENKRLGYEVNVVGTHNVCEAVRNSRSVKGLVLIGSWHTIGETNPGRVVDERFGFRPDMVEERARNYALCKMAQEAILRLHDEESQEKTYGIVRIGTALGENMPKETAANIFIEEALRGEPITPYEHSMYRPMLYVDVLDVCRGLESFALKILNGNLRKSGSSLENTVNVYYPEPVTILELADIVRTSVIEFSSGKIRPEVAVVKTGKQSLFNPEDKKMITVDLGKARALLGLQELSSPKEVIDRIVKDRIARIRA
jgi:nucleoside-diphosphate-sugar epimerase